MRHVYLFSLLAVALIQSSCSTKQSDPSPEKSVLIRGVDPVLLTDENFEREVLMSNQPVLVDMWAEWCQPCIRMKPTIRKLADELSGQVKVGELNVDKNPFITEKYAVDRYPMLLIFVEGVEVKRLVGEQSRKALAEAIRAVRRGRCNTNYEN
ncbi:thioredoxin domain-containing protein [Gimesia sp.]|uniref:thioredoxin domain-containing protein n=1 Tax=Gimesia sp. TaxID=2024833 RepID=UPI003A9291E3